MSANPLSHLGPARRPVVFFCSDPAYFFSGEILNGNGGAVLYG